MRREAIDDASRTTSMETLAESRTSKRPRLTDGDGSYQRDEAEEARGLAGVFGADAATPELTDHETLFAMPLSIIIFGATGDLARKKLFPSLYKLCLQGHLPRDVNIVGYGRSKVERSSFLAKQCVNVADDREWARAAFEERLSFHAGGYDQEASYAELHETLDAFERAHPSGKPGNRLFFLSVCADQRCVSRTVRACYDACPTHCPLRPQVPPTVFGKVAEMISASARAPTGGFTRLMIEKPFGRDSASFEDLNALTAAHFREAQLFRIVRWRTRARPLAAVLATAQRVPDLANACVRPSLAAGSLSGEGSDPQHPDAPMGQRHLRAALVGAAH